MVRVYGKPATARAWTELPKLSSATWTDTLTGTPSCEIALADDIAPADWPAEIIIVPTESAAGTPPVYGPYDLVTPGYSTPAGMSFRGELGHHFGLLFGQGEDTALNLRAQVDGFRSFEPFLGWNRNPSDPLEARLGNGLVGDTILGTLLLSSSLKDVQTALNHWGLFPFVLTEWRGGATYRQRIAVWPKHPLTLLESVTGMTSYAVSPRVGQVVSWEDGAPSGMFVGVNNAGNRALPNEVTAPTGRWQERMTPSLSEYLNSPSAIAALSGAPTWRTREVLGGYQRLDAEEMAFRHFRTGAATRWPPYWISPQSQGGRTSKVAEELLRWDWQNGAAALSAVRIPDLSEPWHTLAIAPHQIITMPAAQLADDWPSTARRFTVRQVRHQWSARDGYTQNISATLYQGGFQRLTATPA